MQQFTNSGRRKQPLPADAEILCRWIVPCAIVPDGRAAFVRIAEEVFMLLPHVQAGAVTGGQFTTSAGHIYLVSSNGHNFTCSTCVPGAVQQDCPHVVALRMVLAAERVLRVGGDATQRALDGAIECDQ